MRYSGIILTAALVVVTPQTTSADVVDRTPNGFTVKVVTDIAASPDAVYLALAAHLSQWWDAAHTYSGDARNLSIVAKAGGCFCEMLPNRGSVEHGVVVQAQPSKLLRMRGAFGPLQEAGVSGALTFALEKTAQGTRLTLTYGAGGYYPGGLDTVAAPVDVVFTQQVTRLKDFAEKQPRR